VVDFLQYDKPVYTLEEYLEIKHKNRETFKTCMAHGELKGLLESCSDDYFRCCVGVYGTKYVASSLTKFFKYYKKEYKTSINIDECYLDLCIHSFDWLDERGFKYIYVENSRKNTFYADRNTCFTFDTKKGYTATVYRGSKTCAEKISKNLIKIVYKL
jgi:hypothetical protein